MNSIFVEKTCAICGKVFIPAVEHIYKETRRGETNWLCSWSCQNRFNEKHPKAKGGRWK